MDSDLEQGPPELARLRAKRALWRVGSWGMLAACALTGTVLIAQTDVGEQRLRLALAPEAVVPVRAVAQAEPSSRPDPSKDAEALRVQTQRLEAQVRVLAADRDRLVARVASLESNVDSMTGAIRRELKILSPATAGEPPPVIEKPQVAAPSSDAPAKVVATLEAKPDAKPEVKADGKPEAKTDAPAKSSEASQKSKGTPPANPVAIESVPMPPVHVASAPTSEQTNSSGKPSLAIDLGGAHTLEILNARWIAVKANFGPLIEGMHPLVAHDRRPNAIPFRLIVGPVGNGAAAAALCQRFAASRVTCRATRYVGDALAAQP